MLAHQMLEVAARRRLAGGGAGISSYKDMVIADGASALWMMDEDTGSNCVELISSLDATLTDSYYRAQSGPAGVGGKSTQLAGGYAITATTGNLDGPTISMEAWFSKSNTAAGNIISYGGANYLRVQVSSAVNAIFSGANILSSPAIDLNSWYHSVIIVSPSGVKIYLNGVLVASTTRPYPTQSAQNSIYIGNGYGSEVLIGSIAGVAIYKKEITAQQVLAHYNAGK